MGDMQTTVANELFESMEPGRVYRRKELCSLSNNLTRDLNKLVEEGQIVRASAGLYYRPRMTSIGPAPASEEELVRGFLSDDRFLLVSFNEYNLLGLGLTQLYNQQFVYNRKRHGEFVLDGRTFSFKRPRDFPDKLTKEFLFVDLFNNRFELSRDTRELEVLLAKRAQEADGHELLRASMRYGKVATRKFFRDVLQLPEEVLAA